MTYHDRLKAARKAKKLTQMQVAIKLGFSQSQLPKYESNGKISLDPSIETLRQLCDLYDVSADWIIGTKFIK